jgi:hypothetical protein
VRRVLTSASSEKPHELGPTRGLFFWLLARYLDPVSDRTFHEMRTDVFLRRAELADTEARVTASMLTSVELMTLCDILHMGECTSLVLGVGARLEAFKLVEPGTLRAGVWKCTPWGKLVAQAAKDGAK